MCRQQAAKAEKHRATHEARRLTVRCVLGRLRWRDDFVHFAGSTASFAGKMLTIRIVYMRILTSDDNRVNVVREKFRMARVAFEIHR
jgi:hypothetical protein